MFMEPLPDPIHCSGRVIRFAIPNFDWMSWFVGNFFSLGTEMEQLLPRQVLGRVAAKGLPKHVIAVEKFAPT